MLSLRMEAHFSFFLFSSIFQIFLMHFIFWYFEFVVHATLLWIYNSFIAEANVLFQLHAGFFVESFLFCFFFPSSIKVPKISCVQVILVFELNLYLQWCLKVRVKNSDSNSCNLKHKIMITYITSYCIRGIWHARSESVWWKHCIDQLQFSNIINFICTYRCCWIFRTVSINFLLVIFNSELKM